MMSLAGYCRVAAGLARRLLCGVSATVLGLLISPSIGYALDLENTDGLSTDTVASRDRQRVWDNSKKYGAEAVSARDRSYLKPDGLHAGEYLIYPTIGTTVTVDDNILAHDIEKKSDIRTDITPEVKFQSQFGRHALDFSLDGRIVNYLENTDQDYANVRGRAEGALHFDHAHTLAIGALTSLEHEERNDPSYPMTAKGPVEVFHNRGAIGITRDVGRLYGTISATAESWNYADTEAVNGTLLSQHGRDTIIYSSQLKGGYRISPGFEVLGKIRASRLENAGDEKIDRDSWGFEALAGFAFEVNPLLRWRILGGYGVKDFDQANLASINTTLVQADVQWLPTQRLTIYATVAREFLETAEQNSTGVVQSSATIKAEYDIFHNLILTAGAEIRQEEYGGLNRTDDIYLARAGLEYFFTKNWLFTFGYEHQVRDSTNDSLDMNRNLFTVGAKLRF
jgi:hypothetical protein